jgi:hypothetical protein
MRKRKHTIPLFPDPRGHIFTYHDPDLDTDPFPDPVLYTEPLTIGKGFPRQPWEDEWDREFEEEERRPLEEEQMMRRMQLEDELRRMEHEIDLELRRLERPNHTERLRAKQQAKRDKMGHKRMLGSAAQREAIRQSGLSHYALPGSAIPDRFLRLY